MSTSSLPYGVDLPEGAVPLLVAPINAYQSNSKSPPQTFASATSSVSFSSTSSSASASSSSSVSASTSLSSSSTNNTKIQALDGNPTHVLFAYAEKFKNPEDKTAIPYLIEKPLTQVPEQLTEYLTPYPVKSSPSSQFAHSQGFSPVISSATSYSFSSSSSTSHVNHESSESTRGGLSRHNSVSVSYPKHLKYMTIINSTLSGIHRSSEIYFAVLVPLLQRFGMSHVYVATSSHQSIPNHAKSFSESSTVVMLSGDTSISEFINCLEPQTHSSKSLNLIVIPTGTGNALANSSGLTSIPKAISRMFLGTPKPLSSFQVQFPKGAHLYNPSLPESKTFTTTVSSNIFNGDGSTTNTSTRISTSADNTRPGTGNSTTSASSTCGGSTSSANSSAGNSSRTSFFSSSSSSSSSGGSGSSSYSHNGGSGSGNGSGGTNASTNNTISSTRSSGSLPNTTPQPETPYLYSIYNNHNVSSSPVFYAIAVVSWAVHASLVSDSDSPEYRHLGEARFRKAAEENLARPQKYTGKLTLGTSEPNNNDQLDVEYLNSFSQQSSSTSTTSSPQQPTSKHINNLPFSLSSNHGYMLFSLVSNIEKTYKISPKSHPPSDLHLHLVHTDYTNNDELLEMMMAPYKEGSHLQIGPRVQYYSLGYKTQPPLSSLPTPSSAVSSTATSPVTQHTEFFEGNSSQTSSTKSSLNSSSTPLAAEIYPEETQLIYQRWCVDGLIFRVPAAQGPVQIHLPSHTVRGWSLFLVT